MLLTLLYFFAPIALLLVALVVGKLIEQAHLRALDRDERRYRPLLLTNLRQPPPGYQPAQAWLCVGSVVVGTDYFKRFAASIKTLFGGRLRTLETVLERARREALVRLLAQADGHGADLVCNVRLETVSIGRTRGDDNTMAAAEVLAYGTAVRRHHSTAAPYRS